MNEKTRFAPSPSGLLHLGNARTALFNALWAGSQGATLLLRIEDTDQERSREEYIGALQQDLHWLGLHWQEGEGAEGGEGGGDAGPYRQSQRLPIYADFLHKLQQQDRVYPCFCSRADLARSRKAQQAAGKPPRYAGTCSRLSAQEVEAKLARGQQPSMRFRVPPRQNIEFQDLVRGRQVFKTNDIGDFIIQRSDGTPAFFFTNAVDDALMGVTVVLRGEDHLTNTPRQLLLLQALGLEPPRYGHIALVLGDDGAPLSKRHGSRSLRELREEGFLPGAVDNYLARLGHSYEDNSYMDLATLAAKFRVSALGRAPARHDPAQLLRWQKEAVAAMDEAALWAWMGEDTRALVPAEHRGEFIAAVRPNIAFPADALEWARALYTPLRVPAGEEAGVVKAAGAAFFGHALELLDSCALDFRCLSQGVKTATGAKGKALFQPLRVALTGRLHGPEMGRLLRLLSPEEVRRRLQQAHDLAAGG